MPEETSSRIIRAENVAESGEVIQLTFHKAITPRFREEADARRLEIRNRLARRAAERAEEAERIRVERLKNAEVEARGILNAAREEAEAIVKRAREQAAAVTEEARRAGQAAAEAAARKKALEEVKGTLVHLEKIAQRLRRERRAFFLSGAEGMIDLIQVVLEKILRRPVNIDRETVKRTLLSAVEKITGTEKIFVRVHPDDLAVAGEMREEILRLVTGVSEIEISPDTGVSRGGVVIDTDFGRIDARISSQIEECLREMRSVVEESVPFDLSDTTAENNASEMTPESAPRVLGAE
ncbi:MAG: hypothetical protein D6679_09820 [Candidatus Hydrogenedentota bacterium]|nr:MAG: hypothetical protein D6679_09820 [Candidatus Hydrogenedentota bacterium]